MSDSLDAQRVVGVVQEVKPSSKKQAPYRMKWTAADGESVETTVNVLTKVDDVINEVMEGRGEVVVEDDAEEFEENGADPDNEPGKEPDKEHDTEPDKEEESEEESRPLDYAEMHRFARPQRGHTGRRSGATLSRRAAAGATLRWAASAAAVGQH